MQVVACELQAFPALCSSLFTPSASQMQNAPLLVRFIDQPLPVLCNYSFSFSSSFQEVSPPFFVLLVPLSTSPIAPPSLIPFLPLFLPPSLPIISLCHRPHSFTLNHAPPLLFILCFVPLYSLPSSTPSQTKPNPVASFLPSSMPSFPPPTLLFI